MKHSAPIRKFEPGASGEFFYEFLGKVGITVKSRKGAWYFVTGPSGGRPNRVRREGLIAIYDRERLKQGLEPIVKRD